LEIQRRLLHWLHSYVLQQQDTLPVKLYLWMEVSLEMVSIVVF
jgi:hypothetical protein